MTKIAEWYRRALQLEEEGLDPGLIGRASRIAKRASGPALPEPPSVLVDVQLPRGAGEAPAAKLSPAAIPILSRYAEDFLRVVMADAIRRIVAEHRKVITKRDVEQIQFGLPGTSYAPPLAALPRSVREKVRELIEKHRLSGSDTAVEALSKGVEDLVKAACARGAKTSRRKAEDPDA